MLHSANRRAHITITQSSRLIRRTRPSALQCTPRLLCRYYSSLSKTKIIFSGIQPTGVPHLGNYLGALQQWKKLQDEAASSTQLFYSIVDFHAITARQGAAQLRESRREMLAALLAIGLKPESCTIFFQSAVNSSQYVCGAHILKKSKVPAHTELMWILSCTAPVGHLSRMTQWKVSTTAFLGTD